MAIPPDSDAFAWTNVQANVLQRAAATLKVFYGQWAIMTAAQKTTFRNQALASLDSVTAELVAIRSVVAGL
jgi:hypothetical protein